MPTHANSKTMLSSSSSSSILATKQKATKILNLFSAEAARSIGNTSKSENTGTSKVIDDGGDQNEESSSSPPSPAWSSKTTVLINFVYLLLEYHRYLEVNQSSSSASSSPTKAASRRAVAVTPSKASSTASTTNLRQEERVLNDALKYLKIVQQRQTRQETNDGGVIWQDNGRIILLGTGNHTYDEIFVDCMEVGVSLRRQRLCRRIEKQRDRGTPNVGTKKHNKGNSSTTVPRYMATTQTSSRAGRNATAQSPGSIKSSSSKQNGKGLETTEMGNINRTIAVDHGKIEDTGYNEGQKKGQRNDEDTGVSETNRTTTDNILERIRQSSTPVGDTNGTISISACTLAAWLQLIFWLRNEYSLHGNDESSRTIGQDLVVDITSRLIEMGRNNNPPTNQFDPVVVDSIGTQNHNRVLFWNVSSTDTNKQCIGASNGLIGILHTLLGLSPDDWALVEQALPQSRHWINNTIDTYFVSPSDDGIPTQLQQNRFWFSSGNIRPYLDAPTEADQTVDWFCGASGLVMLLLHAGVAFNNKDYIIHAHVIMDQGVMPRCRRIITSTQRAKGTPKVSKDQADIKGVKVDKGNGPEKLEDDDNVSGITTIAYCCLQLARFCEGSSLHSRQRGRFPNLKRIWDDRTNKLSSFCYIEWISSVSNDTTDVMACESTKFYGMYDGMGLLACLLWQLSAHLNSNNRTFPSLIAMPLYSSGHFGQPPIPDALLLSSSDVPHSPNHQPSPVLNPPPAIKRTSMKPTKLFSSSPVNTGRLSMNKATHKTTPKAPPDDLLRQQMEIQRRKEEVEKKLADSKARMKKAQEDARRRREQDAAEAQDKMEKAKIRRIEAEKRRAAELERRKSSYLDSRQRAERQAEIEERRKEIQAAKRKEQDDKRRQALVKARQAAQDRIEAKREKQDMHELQRQKDEARKKQLEHERRLKHAEDEKKRRAAILETRLRREAEQAEKARNREAEERAKMERSDQKRQQLKQQELERKRREAERRRKHEELLARKRQEEESDREKKSEEAKRREAQAEKRRLEARARQKEQLEIQEAQEEKRREEVLSRKLSDEQKRRLELEKTLHKRDEKHQTLGSPKTVDSTTSSTPKSGTKTEYQSASNGSKPIHAKLPRYAAPTRASNFWSLQTDYDVGSSNDSKSNQESNTPSPRTGNTETETDPDPVSTQSSKKSIKSQKRAEKWQKTSKGKRYHEAKSGKGGS